MIAAAATLLLAVTLALRLRGVPESTAARPSGDVAVKTPHAPLRSAVADGDHVAGVAHPSAPSEANSPAVAAGSIPLQWSDPFDQRIDRAGRAMVQLRDDSLASAAGPGLIQDEFDNVRKGFNRGPFD
jgi:hypothetical protein